MFTFFQVIEIKSRNYIFIYLCIYLFVFFVLFYILWCK